MRVVEKPGYTLCLSCLQSDGTFCDISDEQAAEALHDEKRLIWLNVVVKDVEAARDLLQNQMGFHELAVEDSLSDNERPALQEFDSHLFVAGSKVMTTKSERESYTEIGLFLCKNGLVTVVREPIPLLDEWFRRFEKHPHPFDEAAPFLMHSILDHIVDEYFVAIDVLEDEVDELADEIYQGDTSRISDILILKKRLMEMRRHITPTRDILNGLLRHNSGLIPPATKLYFQDIYDHTLRIAEIADVNRDTLTSLLDVHLSTVSNNLNNVMKKMTVISTVLMSAALIAGVYGMNFKEMPELNWWWGYPFAIILMVVSGLGILWLFRWKKWI